MFGNALKFGLCSASFFLVSQAYGLDRGWEGTWSGPCQGSQFLNSASIVIGNPELPSFDWRILYPGQSPRNYTMRRTANENRFELDENNGIVINNFLFGNCLIDQFQVGQSRIDSRTCLTNNGTLTFEVVTAGVTPYSESRSGASVVRDFQIRDRYVCTMSLQ